MFEKLKLRNYLLGIFSLIINLITVMALGSNISMWNTRRDTKGLDNMLDAAEAVKICRVESNIVARDLREVLLLEEKEEAAQLKESIEQNVETIQKQIAVFKKNYKAKDGLAEKYETAFNEWISLVSKALTAAEEGRMEESKQIVLKETAPVLKELSSIAEEIDTTINAKKAHVSENLQRTTAISIGGNIVVYILIVIVCVIIASRATQKIVRVMNKIRNAADELSNGNLDAYVDYDSKNEFGELAKKMNFSFRELNKYVKAIDYAMKELSDGNFAYEQKIEFRGDFANIQNAIQMFRKKMNHTLQEVDSIANQVNNGSEQLAQGTQSLAQGAAEQAESIESLHQTVSRISEQIANNAEFTRNADELGKETGIVIVKSQDEMKQMVQAIEDISTASENIRKIIKVIDDIAFQTNILALNAAVEAARAGEAGKGFAVVADEVRNLAQKSAEAAKNTTDLIEKTLTYVENGEKLAFGADAAFDEVAEHSKNILQMIEKISDASDGQAQAIADISMSVEQISSVVQINSATSEESVAASEELSEQANVMKSLIEMFHLAATV